MLELEQALMRLAQLACDVAEIAELDINPLLADAQGVIALDARVRLAVHPVSAVARLAIRPYPSELEEAVDHHGRRLLLRPIRPEDTPRHREFLARVTPRDLYLRFFTGVRELPEADLAHLTQIDYDRDMAFVAIGRDPAGAEEILGVARACADPDNSSAEFAVLVRSDHKGQGLGTLLMHKLIRYCRERGTRELRGNVMADNAVMLQLARTLGFKVRGTEQNIEIIALELQGPPAPLGT
jgi:acetyltransferase